MLPVDDLSTELLSIPVNGVESYSNDPNTFAVLPLELIVVNNQQKRHPSSTECFHFQILKYRKYVATVANLASFNHVRKDRTS